MDKLHLRSLLDGSGILTYVEFENTNSLFPGLAISGHSESYISVLEDDLENARPLVLGYIEDRRQALNVRTNKNLGEAIVDGMLTMDGMRGPLPELLS